MLIMHIIDDFIRSDTFRSWQSERIESGAYSRNAENRDRFERCYDAAEDGADGSTHREHINDMREAFDWYCCYGKSRWGSLDRVRAAADKYFDDLEAWHEKHGTLDEQIG